MTERSIDDLGWLDVRAAGWWLGLLYRRPKQFHDRLAELPKSRMLRVGATLFIHAIIYAIVIAALGRWCLFVGLGLPLANAPPDQILLLRLHGELLAVGIALGVAFGIAAGIAFGIAGGLAVGIAVGIAVGTTVGIAGGAAGGIEVGIAVGITVGIAGGIAGGTAVGIAARIALGIALGIGAGIAGGTEPP